MSMVEVPIEDEILAKAREELRAFNAESITSKPVNSPEGWLPLQVNATMQSLIRACRAVQTVRQPKKKDSYGTR